MQEKRQALFDFSKMAEDAESLSEVLAAQQHVLSADFASQGGRGSVEKGTETEEAEERLGREENQQTERPLWHRGQVRD